ncbi:unnamed protein product, partial [Prunus brigantina]
FIKPSSFTQAQPRKANQKNSLSSRFQLHKEHENESSIVHEEYCRCLVTFKSIHGLSQHIIYILSHKSSFVLHTQHEMSKVDLKI